MLILPSSSADLSRGIMLRHQRYKSIPLRKDFHASPCPLDSPPDLHYLSLRPALRPPGEDTEYGREVHGLERPREGSTDARLPDRTRNLRRPLSGLTDDERLPAAGANVPCRERRPHAVAQPPVLHHRQFGDGLRHGPILPACRGR